MRHLNGNKKAPLFVLRNEKGKHGYVDTTGKVVLDCQFDYAYKFENGQAKVK